MCAVCVRNRVSDYFCPIYYPYIKSHNVWQPCLDCKTEDFYLNFTLRLHLFTFHAAPCEGTYSVWHGSLFVLIYSCTEAEFWDVLGTKVLRVSSLLFTFTTTNGNLNSENSQDYTQKTQRNCTFMNSAAIQCTMLVHMYLYITDWMDRKQGVKINPFTDCLSL
jgi:hypothetical protein